MISHLFSFQIVPFFPSDEKYLSHHRGDMVENSCQRHRENICFLQEGVWCTFASYQRSKVITMKIFLFFLLCQTVLILMSWSFTISATWMIPEGWPLHPLILYSVCFLHCGEIFQLIWKAKDLYVLNVELYVFWMF